MPERNRYKVVLVVQPATPPTKTITNTLYGESPEHAIRKAKVRNEADLADATIISETAEQIDG